MIRKIAEVSILILFVILQLSLNAQDTWELLSTTGDVPSPRKGHSFNTIGDMLYLYGGVDDSSSKGKFGTIHTYNANMREWDMEEWEHVIPRRTFHKTMVKDSRLYVFYGMGVDFTLDDIWRYDPHFCVWDILPAPWAIMPPARSEHSVTLDGNTVYVVGGKDSEGNPLADCWGYRFSTDVWQRYADIPSGTIHGHSAAFADGKLYIFGGLRNGSILTPEILVYSPGSGSWSTIMPTGDYYPTANASSVQFTDKVFLFGGYSGFYEGSSFVWDLSTHNFEQIADGPPVAYGAAAYIPSGATDKKSTISYEQFFFFGGENDDGLHNECWVYTSNIETVGIEDDETNIAPNAFELVQNYPNPFNSSTSIEYTLFENTSVELTIYDIQGRLVKTLVNGVQPSGTHKAIWNAMDDTGKSVSSGIYLYKLTTSDGHNLTKRMFYLK